MDTETSDLPTADELLDLADSAAGRAVKALNSGYQHQTVSANAWATLANFYLARHRVQRAAECFDCRGTGEISRKCTASDCQRLGNDRPEHWHAEPCPRPAHHV